jgi:hypothetical protein
MLKYPATHTAFALKRETRTSWRWLEIGGATIENDGRNGTHRVRLDRLPIGAFTGEFLLQPIGMKPPDPLPEPERPAEDNT